MWWFTSTVALVPPSLPCGGPPARWPWFHHHLHVVVHQTGGPGSTINSMWCSTSTVALVPPSIPCGGLPARWPWFHHQFHVVVYQPGSPGSTINSMWWSTSTVALVPPSIPCGGLPARWPWFHHKFHVVVYQPGGPGSTINSMWWSTSTVTLVPPSIPCGGLPARWPLFHHHFHVMVHQPGGPGSTITSMWWSISPVALIPPSIPCGGPPARWPWFHYHLLHVVVHQPGGPGSTITSMWWSTSPVALVPPSIPCGGLPALWPLFHHQFHVVVYQPGGPGSTITSMWWSTSPVALVPPSFPFGDLAGIFQDVTKDQLEELYPEMEAGGRLRPPDCVPRQRLAIILPYRNRYPHLHITLQNLIPMLKRQQADITFFVVEQAPPSTFNKGALLNAGFIEANKLGNFDCYILHDVDLIPLNDFNMYRCDSNPRHYAVSIDKYNFQLLFSAHFGGVVGFARSHYLKVNGNSNLYLGWGGEDDDFRLRLVNKNFTIQRYPLQTARYSMIKHTRDRGNEINPLRNAILLSSKARQDIDGLNTVRYKVLNIAFERLYTWITVSINNTEILQSVPAVTLVDIKNAKKKWLSDMALMKKKQQLNNSGNVSSKTPNI
ncbi:Zinc finger protein containing five transmembrane domains [Bulinus truncatus]|nr:Zinc finger protein containing five transmembrane domains [Bulinus truncatus]